MNNNNVEVVVAVFPEITTSDENGNKTAFEYKANKKYAGRGNEADAIRKLKENGADYFINHLTEEGKKWYEEKIEVEKDGNTVSKYPNKHFIQVMFSKPRM